MDEITKHHYRNIATGNAKKNKDGSLSTVSTRQVDLPDKTGKRVPTLIPSIWNGKMLSEEDAVKKAKASGKKWPTAKTHTELRKFDIKIHEDMKPIPAESAAAALEEAEVRESASAAKEFAKGGAVPMNNMAKQMEMFDEGGLMDEGGTVDPVSGNDVPPGSTQEEVRDDIPAQLSEGEFVFPADVVRFIGLEKLMKIRQRAKAGLQRMEDMGQMGNSEEAIMPDTLPFSIEDLDMEDEGEYNTPQEFALGGAVQMANTNYTTTPNSGQNTRFRRYVERAKVPTFGQTVGTNPGQYDYFLTYENGLGQTLQIPFKNGRPLYPIPPGYVLKPQEDDETETVTTTKTVEEVEPPEGEGDDDPSPMDGGMGFGEFGHENATDDEMGDDDVGGGASTGSSNSGGGHSMGDGTSGVGYDDDEAYCLTEDMKVKLNGTIDFVTNIKVGDMIDNYKVKEVLHKHMRSGYYAINNELKISNDHPVLANGTWTRPEDLVVGDSINGIPVSSLEYVEQLTPTVSIVIDGESFDVHTENNIYTVHGRYKEVRQEAA